MDEGDARLVGMAPDAATAALVVLRMRRCHWVVGGGLIVLPLSTKSTVKVKTASLETASQAEVQGDVTRVYVRVQMPVGIDDVGLLVVLSLLALVRGVTNREAVAAW
mmetsp:Transcript_27936/g.41636  ORF Transcript_27936/g.41636 Transcript_27936/m.41636 type:complete len:107 (-) Transcript_27936:464-784(-)